MIYQCVAQGDISLCEDVAQLGLIRLLIESLHYGATERRVERQTTTTAVLNTISSKHRRPLPQRVRDLVLKCVLHYYDRVATLLRSRKGRTGSGSRSGGIGKGARGNNGRDNVTGGGGGSASRGRAGGRGSGARGLRIQSATSSRTKSGRVVGGPSPRARSAGGSRSVSPSSGSSSLSKSLDNDAGIVDLHQQLWDRLLYTSPSPRDRG